MSNFQKKRKDLQLRFIKVFRKVERVSELVDNTMNRLRIM